MSGIGAHCRPAVWRGPIGSFRREPTYQAQDWNGVFWSATAVASWDKAVIGCAWRERQLHTKADARGRSSRRAATRMSGRFRRSSSGDTKAQSGRSIWQLAPLAPTQSRSFDTPPARPRRRIGPGSRKKHGPPGLLMTKEGCMTGFWPFRVPGGRDKGVAMSDHHCRSSGNDAASPRVSVGGSPHSTSVPYVVRPTSLTNISPLQTGFCPRSSHRTGGCSDNSVLVTVINTA